MNKNTQDILKALDHIRSEYRSIIEGDSVLKHDFQKLRGCLAKDSDENVCYLSMAKECDKMLDHLRSELRECADDDQRIRDESPMWADEAMPSRDQRYYELKRELDNFYLHYITKQIEAA